MLERVPCTSEKHSRHCPDCQFYGKIQNNPVTYKRSLYYNSKAWFFPYRAAWEPVSASVGYIIPLYGKRFRTHTAALNWLNKQREKLEC